jgi:predicted secreted Zn-dependent protease
MAATPVTVAEAWERSLAAIREHVAAAHGMTVPAMCQAVRESERADRCPGSPFAQLPTAHQMNGGTDCDGC